MSITINRIYHDEVFTTQLNHIIDRMLYEYADEFAAQGFLDAYEKAYIKLKYVNNLDGKLPNSELNAKGYRRALIKKYHYVIIYKYQHNVVQLRYIFPSRMDYLKLIK